MNLKENVMNALKTKIATVAALALLAGASITGQAAAACGDADFDLEVRTFHHSSEVRGAWTNPYMPHGTGNDATASADEVLAGILAGYTRDVLDRGGWFNAWVASPGYDAGNPLLAVRQGEGVTHSAARQPPAFAAPRHTARARTRTARPGAALVWQR
jgi:hypothetical protein